MKDNGVIPGIKVDKGAHALAGFEGEKITDINLIIMLAFITQHKQTYSFCAHVQVDSVVSHSASNSERECSMYPCSEVIFCHQNPTLNQRCSTFVPQTTNQQIIRK